ncbi:MAG: hypothetical protein JJU18_11920 [Oceanicaulis sp.]|nr:hypothetical protein [Oceanicaulis sp.]
MSVSLITAAAVWAASAAAAPAGPHLAGDDYLAARGAPLEALAITQWTRTRAPLDGGIEAAGSGVTFAVRLGADWAGWRSADGPESLADWRTRRLLTLSPDGADFTNASLYGETRRRLDTYVALSGAGALEEIAFGAAGVFHRIWLEAAMGVAPAQGTLDIEDTAPGFTASFDGERVFHADFGGGPDSLCQGAALTGAEARSARYWLRHAAPVHPDVIDQLAAAEVFPCAFELTVYSPDSPQGRLERWVLNAPPAASEDDAPETPEALTEPEPETDADDAPGPQDAELSLTEILDRLARGEDAGMDADAMLRALAAPEPEPAPRTLPAAPAATPAQTDPSLALRLPAAPDARVVLQGEAYLETAGEAALAAVTGEGGRAPDEADFYEAFEIARSSGRLADALLITVQETHHFGPCPQDAVVGGARLTCTLVRDLARSGIGQQRYERAAQGVDAALEGAHRSATEALAPFIELDGPGGAAARLLTAGALIGWGPDGLAARPDLDPAGLMLEVIESDPFAQEAYWRMGQRFMEAGAPETAWTLFDLGRNLPGREPGPGLSQVSAIEARLAELAPHWLPAPDLP